MVNPTDTSTSTLQSLRLNLASLVIAAGVALFSATVSNASPGARYGAETARRDASMRISAAGAHACHVKEDGSVRCWGNNDDGQIGNGNTTDQRIPVAVSGLAGVIAVAAGGEISVEGFTCAVLVGGTARCWGANVRGQLGNGTSGGPRLTPVAVSGLSDAVAITAGNSHACSLHSTGTVRCWGENGEGQLGDGTTVDRVIPVPVSGVTNVVAVDAGVAHTCAVLADGTARCWGRNSSGQLGNGTSGTPKSPAVVVSGLNGVKTISTGTDHTCALLADGTARCWGLNVWGALGNGTVNVSSSSPVFVSNLTNATGISAGYFSTCASLANGTARCWGLNSQGQLGNSETGGQESIAVAVTGLTIGVAITTNGVYSCALLVEGSVACWGSNESGELGTGTLASRRNFPSNVSGGGGGFTARDVAAGRNHTCAVRANGTVACWGDNDAGQIGDGTFGVDRLLPVTVPLLTNVVAITAGEAHTCALTVAGRVACWGDNGSGQLGIGGINAIAPSPVMISSLTNVAAISAGGGIAGSHTCALLANGQLRCWGANASGQLGNGSTTSTLSPVSVPGQTFMTAIAAGELHTCALRATGVVRCWGSNANGQLGDGTQIDHRRPADVNGTGFMAALAAGNLHSCALPANASVWCWGENVLGQLGDFSTTPHPVPVQVLSGLVANRTVAIAGGFGHTCAVIFSGAVRCWGDNSAGQLGNATTISATAPVVVETVRTVLTIGIGGPPRPVTIRTPLSNSVTIAAGRRHTCALLSTGAVYCWGENSSGQLGINTTTNALSPAAVPSFTLNIDTTVHLEGNYQAATVTIVANCKVDQTLHFDIALTQGEVSATREASALCTGRLARYPLRVQLGAGKVFTEGAAKVAAAAIIKHERDEETQKWTRNVTIVRAP